MDKQTVETYNRDPHYYANKFAGIGPRVEDIAKVFKILNIPNPKVIELGCGDGRDAVKIIEFTDDYVGVDISNGLLDIARHRLPEAVLVAADIASFDFPTNVHAFFAFASLLHCDKKTNAAILRRAYSSLVKGGVVHLSLKKGSYQDQGVRIVDGVGERLFFFYQLEDILEISGGYDLAESHEKRISSTDWLEVTLVKR